MLLCYIGQVGDSLCLLCCENAKEQKGALWCKCHVLGPVSPLPPSLPPLSLGNGACGCHEASTQQTFPLLLST